MPIVQTAYQDNNTSFVSSMAATFGSAQTATNSNAVWVYYYNTGGVTISGVTDTANNTYTLEHLQSEWDTGNISALYFCESIAANASNTVTAALAGGTTQYAAIIIAEASGITAFENYAFGVNNPQSTPNSSPTVSYTTTHNGDLLMALCVADSAAYTGPGAGWTQNVETPSQKIALLSQVAGTAGSQTCTFTVGTAAYWGILMGAFQYSAPAAPPTVVTSATSNLTTTSVTLNGSITATGGSNSTVEGFNYGLTTGYGSQVSNSGSFGTGNYSCNVTGLMPGTTYHYQAYATNTTGTGTSSDATFVTLNTVPPSGQEVIFNGTQIGTSGSEGSTGDVIANLFDANELTYWESPDASGDWAGIDAGAATTLTRVRLSPIGAYEDLAIGGQIQASNSATFASGNTTLFTIATRPATGLLLNEYSIPIATGYRYFRYVSASGAFGWIADLEFVGFNVTGVTGQCSYVNFSPNGGIYDLTTLVTLSTITSGASIYYTLDGSTPTTGSTLYTGPFTVSSNCTIKAIAAASGLSNSRVTSQIYSVNGQIISTNNPTDVNRGARVWTINPNFMFDPVGGLWWMYGWSSDQVSVYTYQVGINAYSSPDLRNWTFQGSVLSPASAEGSTALLDRFHVLYNAANNNYVAWARSTNGSTVFGPYQVYTATSPAGPFTNVQSYSTLDTHSTGGDMKAWLDPSSGYAYLFWTVNGNNTVGVTRLNSTFTATDGTNHQYWSNAAGPFGTSAEGHGVALVNGVYFWMASETANWASTVNNYATATNLMGTWTTGGNPFQNVVVSQTPGEVTAGVTPTYSNAYDTQTNGLILIPGRGVDAVFYVGDRYDLLSPGNLQSNTDSFVRHQTILLPCTFPTTTTMTITWNDAWSFDSTFPTVSGAPAAATGFSVINLVASWTNNGVASIYLDSATDSGFTSNLVSQVVPVGVTSAAVTSVNNFYRIRTVNASGTSYSTLTQNTAGATGATGFNTDLLNAAEAALGGTPASTALSTATPHFGLHNIKNAIYKEIVTPFRL